MTKLRSAALPAEELFYEQLVGCLPGMRAFARLLCRDPDQSDDLVQDAVVRALAAWQQFQPGTNFKAWMFTILRNLSISNKRRHRPCATLDDETLEEVRQEPTQEDAVALKELDVAVRGLSENQREALILAVVHGLAYEDVALICGCAPGTIKSRVSRARTELIARMRGQAVGEEGGSPLQRAEPVRASSTSAIPLAGRNRHAQQPLPALSKMPKKAFA